MDVLQSDHDLRDQAVAALMAEHPDIDSHGVARQTCCVQTVGGTHRGVTHVMWHDGKPTCPLRTIVKIHPVYSEWKALGEQKVECWYCLHGVFSHEVSGREPSGGDWGRSHHDVVLNPPKDFERADEAERKRRMARRLPLDTPWR